MTAVTIVTELANMRLMVWTSGSVRMGPTMPSRYSRAESCVQFQLGSTYIINHCHLFRVWNIQAPPLLSGNADALFAEMGTADAWRYQATLHHQYLACMITCRRVSCVLATSQTDNESSQCPAMHLVMASLLPAQFPSFTFVALLKSLTICMARVILPCQGCCWPLGPETLSCVAARARANIKFMAGVRDLWVAPRVDRHLLRCAQPHSVLGVCSNRLWRL